jgi:hypothetical protein
MKRIPILLGLFVLLLIVPVSKAQEFQPGCQFRFQLKDLNEERDLDADCPIQGAGSNASKAQNRVKNNFCAPGNPVVVTVTDLRNLQRLTEQRLRSLDIPFGSPTSIPEDRSELAKVFTLSNGKRLFEGKVVTLVAFLRDAHHSNVKNGEKVNCSKKGKSNNDIHAEFIPSPGSDPCLGISAEISPHFRPPAWEQFVDYSITHPVRITGQLMFDASHSPCKNVGTSNEKRASPGRISSWEIHPIYAISVGWFRKHCRKRTRVHFR